MGGRICPAWGSASSAFCCAVETQCSQVRGRKGLSASDEYQPGGRCSVTSEGGPGGGRLSVKVDTVQVDEIGLNGG